MPKLTCPCPSVNMAAAKSSARECCAAGLQHFFSENTVNSSARLLANNWTSR
jgi:hypothetical protein